MDNPETLATLDTRYRTKTNKTKKHNIENYKVKLRETRRGKQEWTIQRHW